MIRGPSNPSKAVAVLKWGLGLWMCLGWGQVSLAQGTTAAATPPASQPVARPMVFDQVIQKGDRLLFVGDEVTQQMYYTRMVAAALLAVKPHDGLRIYNGGYDGATAGSAIKWIDDLLDLTKPTVVFICLGINDCLVPSTDGDVVGLFKNNLAQLIDRLRLHKEVRQVILLTPPAVEQGGATLPVGTGGKVAVLEPATLKNLAQATVEVAAKKKIGVIDLYTYLEFVYDNAASSPGESMTIGGRMPSELGHAVISSAILKGIGLESQWVDAVGWSPLSARKMARVRSALALQLRTPGLEKTQVSQDLMVALGRFDEAFFKAWRLAGRAPSTGSRPAALVTAEQAWRQVVRLVEDSYGQAALKDRGSSSPPKD